MYITEIKNWNMNFEQFESIPCMIPCSVYSVLLDNDLIKHPYIGLNEKDLTKLSEKDCEFYTEFYADETVIDEEFNVLRFKGLDTLCEIYLNDKLLAETDNMHRTYEFYINDKLVKGKNTLRVYIKSPIKYAREMDARYHAYTNPDTVQGAAHIRKASYMFGWDWSPTLPDMGICGNVELISYSVARFKNAFIRQFHEDGKVRLEISTEIIGNQDVECSLSFDNKEYTFSNNKCSIEVENPKLWYPNGMGEQNLYDLDFVIKYDGKILDTMSKTIGLRTISVCRDKDEYGREFSFVVNGYKIFAKGSNYIPADNIINRITAEKVTDLIYDAAKANHNMVRIWGGGLYPSDEFFDACDRAGIIVWQDFMIGCIQVYMREKFEATMVAEAIEQVERIRHHASLGLLCGNNEMEVSPAIFGFDKDMLMVVDYLRLHERLLPDICEKYAPDVFYLPSSPTSGGGFNNPGDENSGDAHFWGVYCNKMPYSEYEKHYWRFLSEFGMQSFPNNKTVNFFANGDEKNANSTVMTAHQKSPGGTAIMLSYINQDYLYANDFDTLVYASHIMQANAVKTAVEHMRRNRNNNRCMGTLYWMLNDCWPVLSWSSIDYFGRWKALHYASKRFYAPVLLTAKEKGSVVTFNVSNESLKDFNGIMTYKVLEADGKIVAEDSCIVNSGKLFSVNVLEKDFSEYITGYERTRFIRASLKDNEGNIVSCQTLIFVKPKDFCFAKPQIKVDIEKVDKKVAFTVESDVPAFNVELDFSDFDIKLCDNYFDIADGKITVCAETDIDVEQLKKALIVRSVWDIR